MDSAGLALASLVALLAAIAVYLHQRVFSYWSSRGVRGPRPWPLLGTNIYYLLGNKLEVDKKWRAKYGKTYGLYEGYSPLLRTTGNELIKDVFIKQHSSFTDRNNQFTYEPVQRNWLLWSEGAQWANQRALVSPMFSSAKMRPWLSVMSGCFDRFKGAVSERLVVASSSSSSSSTRDKGEKSQPQQQQQVMVATLDKTELGCLLLELIGLSFFGLRVDTYTGAAAGQVAGENEFLREARRVSELQVHRFLIWLFLPRRLAKMFTYELVPYDCYKYFDLLTKRIIEERRSKKKHVAGGGTTSSPKDFVQFFLEARLPDTYEQVFGKDDDREAHYNDQTKHDQLERVQREQTSSAKLFKNFSDLQIRGHMTFMFVAGFETTAGTLAFCLYELAHKPHVQQVLLDELAEALGGREKAREVARTGWPKSESKSSVDLLVGLRYLDAFVAEVMRLYANIIELNRRVTNPAGAWLNIDGRGRVWLEPGTPVSVAPFVVQRDPDYFEAPDEFRLERFLPENRDKIPSCTFMPFGLGPRHCVGMRFALMALKLIVARTLLSYEISPGPNTQVYPPAGYQQNTIFLVPHATDFRLAPRK